MKETLIEQKDKSNKPLDYPALGLTLPHLKCLFDFITENVDIGEIDYQYLKSRIKATFIANVKDLYQLSDHSYKEFRKSN